MWEGNKLKNVIKDKGLTVTSLARKVGVSRTAVNDWIKGTVPSGLHLVKVCQLLSITPDHFFSMETGNISIPLHRKKGAAKVKEAYREAALELVEEYEKMFRNAPPPGLESSLRKASYRREDQIALAQQLRALSKIESHNPMDYQKLFDLLVQLRIVTIFRRFPKAIKGYAFYCRIHQHRVIFVNTATNVLDLIFPVLHEVIHAIRSKGTEEPIYDDEEETYCDTVAGLAQFPQQYVDLIMTTLEEKTPAAKVNTLKTFSSTYGHSLYGIAERIRKTGSDQLEDINVAPADTNLKKHFRTLEEVLFDPPDPATYIHKLMTLSPMFIAIVKDQVGTASTRKVGEWLGLDNVMDAKRAIAELSRLN